MADSKEKGTRRMEKTAGVEPVGLSPAECLEQPEFQRGTHHLVDLSSPLATVTMGMMCKREDGRPLGTVDFIDQVLETGFACRGLMHAAMQNPYPAALLFVQQDCAGGETGLLRSVQHDCCRGEASGNPDVLPEQRIVLPEELEGSDGIAVLFGHSSPYRLLDISELLSLSYDFLNNLLILGRDERPLPYWIDMRYRSNNPCGILYFGQFVEPDVDGTSISTCVFKSADRIVRRAQLGWPINSALHDSMDVYGITSEAGPSPLYYMSTGEDYRLTPNGLERVSEARP